jgi:hypothetical protein
MNRIEIVREIATDLKVRARVCGLKRLAEETTELYDELIHCRVPPEAVYSYFLVGHLRERIDEERRNQRFR